LFVTLDIARYMKYKLEAAKFVSGRRVDVELIVTMIYTTYVMGNATTMQNQTYPLTVLRRYHIIKQVACGSGANRAMPQ